MGVALSEWGPGRRARGQAAGRSLAPHPAHRPRRPARHRQPRPAARDHAPPTPAMWSCGRYSARSFTSRQPRPARCPPRTWRAGHRPATLTPEEPHPCGMGAALVVWGAGGWPAPHPAAAVTSAASSAPRAPAVTGVVPASSRCTYLVAHGVPKNVPCGTRSPLAPGRRGTGPASGTTAAPWVPPAHDQNAHPERATPMWQRPGSGPGGAAAVRGRGAGRDGWRIGVWPPPEDGAPTWHPVRRSNMPHMVGSF